MSALADYYAAAADKLRAEASQLVPAQAGQAAAQGGASSLTAASEAGLRGAQGGYYGSLTGKTGAETTEQTRQTRFANSPLTPDEEESARSLYGKAFGGGSQSLLDNSQFGARGIAGGNLTPVTGQVPSDIKSALGYNTGTNDVFGYNMGSDHMMNYDKGGTNVPGEGDGSHDTVHAMLAPGEAVLNRGAAEHIGRGLIKHFNDIGARHMAATGHTPDGMKGMPPPKSKPAPVKTPAGKPGTPGYVMGTSDTMRGPAPQSDILAGMSSPLNTPSPQPSGGQQLVNQIRSTGRAMGDADVQNPHTPNYSMGTEYVEPFKYATSNSGRGNPENGGGQPAPREDTTSQVAPKDDMQGTTKYAEQTNLGVTGMQVSPGKGMPKRSTKGYAKGTAKVAKGGGGKGTTRGGGKMAAPPAAGAGPIGQSLTQNAPQDMQGGDMQQQPMDPRLQALLQAAGAQQ